ncbi:unnamed protein product, partial [marine sediment metagenome]
MKLSPELLTGVAVFSVFLVAFAWLKVHYFIRDTTEYIRSWKKEPPASIKKLTDIEVELTLLTDSHAALHTGLKN